MSDCVLGIDGGGTKTACVLVTADGRVLARSQSSGSNYHAVGTDAARQHIRQAIAQAIDQAIDQTSPELPIALEIGGIGLGLAGVASSEDAAIVRGWVASYIAEGVGNCRWTFEANDRPRLYIDHDCAIALTGGVTTADGSGIAAIAGTGSIVFGRNDTGHTVRVGGWGYLFGDEGGGYDLARRAVQAALQAADGRGEDTQLLDAFLQHFQARSPRDLVMRVYGQQPAVDQLAALSTIVDRVATEGDTVACAVVNQGAAEIARAICACGRQLFSRDRAFEVVTIGGVWQAKSGFRDQAIEAVQSQFPRAEFIWPRSSPAEGAALTVLRAIAQFG